MGSSRRHSTRLREKAAEKASSALHESTLGTFHLVQGLNYVLVCPLLAHLALRGTKSAMVPARLGELYETYATPGDFSGKLERTLLAMYWLAPFTVGVAYIAGRNDVAMVYSTFLTMLLALVMQCRMMLSPIAFVLTIVAPVDLGGLLVKYKLLRDDTAGLKRGGFYGTFGRHPSVALFMRGRKRNATRSRRCLSRRRSLV